MRTRVAIIRPTVIVLLAALAACAGGSPGSPSLSTADQEPATSPTVAPTSGGTHPASVATPSPLSTPGSSATRGPGSPTTVLLAEPPVATIEGLIRGPADGDLGTMSWAGTTSDAPWIVGPTIGHVAAGTPLTVTFDPSIQPGSWQARWAPLDGRDVGAPRDGGSGSGGLISVTAPVTSGDWGLQVEARFGPDSSGAWYWRIRVDR